MVKFKVLILAVLWREDNNEYKHAVFPRGC